MSANAVLALNHGAALGGFAHDTGEGGISECHLRYGGDLIWEVGTGYFGCRTKEGDFDPRQFAEQAARDEVKCVSLKLSQGAKPGSGGLLPGSKVNAEIARARGVPEGETVVSPSYRRVFSMPRELIRFMALCKAMLAEGSAPDFIIVDGSEGGTGAAPLEFADRLGRPLTDGLLIVHKALTGTGLRDRTRIGASGKVATGADIVKLHPGPALPHQYLSRRRHHPGPTPCPRPRRARQVAARPTLPDRHGCRRTAADGALR